MPAAVPVRFSLGGNYVYEKTFQKPAEEHVIFQFEGVYKNAKVYINGKEAGGANYGYIPFFICADGLLVEGENTIRVECENNDQPESRWYTGAGIYRPVWLWTGAKGDVEPEQVRVHTCFPSTLQSSMSIPAMKMPKLKFWMGKWLSLPAAAVMWTSPFPTPAVVRGHLTCTPARLLWRAMKRL